VFNLVIVIRGVARIFQRGGGGTRCQNEVTHQMFMPFLPPVEGYSLKTRLTGGEGVTWARTLTKF